MSAQGYVLQVRTGPSADVHSVQVYQVPELESEAPQLLVDALIAVHWLPGLRTAVDLVALVTKTPVAWTGLAVVPLELDARAQRTLKALRRIL